MIKKPTLQDDLTDQSALSHREKNSDEDVPDIAEDLHENLQSVDFEKKEAVKGKKSEMEIGNEDAYFKIGASYFENFTTKIKEILEEGVLHLKNTIGLNFDILLLKKQVNENQEIKRFYETVQEKVKKIGQGTFNWKVEHRSLPHLKQIFGIADIFFDPHHFLFLDFQNLQEILPPQYFIAFMHHPYHSYDENDQIFFEVTEFYSIILSAFKKLYISFPMSTQPKIYPSELNLLDPFMRQHYRTLNQTFFQKHSGLPADFRLIDFLTKIMEKFVFSGLPRWEQRSGKPLLVPFLGLVAECFDYGLIDPCQCDLLLSQLYMISELLSSLEQQIEQKYSGNGGSVEKCYQEFMQCRIEISNIVIQVICVYCDFDYLDSVVQLQANPLSKSVLRYFLQDKEAAYSNISLIVLKYLAPKLEIAKIKQFSQSLENNISLIFNFIGDYQNDFFTQSLSLIRSEYIENYINKDMEASVKAKSILLNFIDYINLIRTANTSKIKEIESSFLPLIAKTKELLVKNQEGYAFHLEFSKNNIPSLLLQIIDYLDRTGINSSNMIFEGLFTLGLILKGNYPAQSVLFTGHTFSIYQSIFLRRYLVAMSMMQFVFHDDYRMFNLSNRVFMIKIRIYKQMIKAFREEYGKDQNSDKFVDIIGALYVFNYFFDNILDSNLLKVKNKKRYDLVIAAEIVEVVEDLVFPAFFDSNFLLDYSEVNFDKAIDLSDLRNFEQIRTYFRGKKTQVALYEIYFSFLKLLNKSTFFVYSGDVFEKIKKLADAENFEKLPKNFPGEIYLRVEMLKLFDRFHLFFTNHLLTKRGLYNKNAAVIIGEVFIPANTWSHLSVFLNEFKWFQNFMSVPENKPPKANVIIGKYLLKGLLAMLYKYLKGILVFLTIMETPSNIEALKKDTEKVIGEFKLNKEKYYQYVQNMLSKATDFISEFNEKKGESGKNENGISDVEKQLGGNLGQANNPVISKLTKASSVGNNETNFESDILEERINPNLRFIRENIMEVIDALDKIYDITGDCRYIVNRYTRNTEIDCSKDSMLKNLHSMKTFQNQNSLKSNKAKRVKQKNQSLLDQIKQKYREKKSYYNLNPTENRFVEYLTQDINSSQYNKSIAEFFVDQMVNMESCLTVAEYERSFYINDIYMQYIITMNNLLSWTAMMRVELHAILYVSKCKKENVTPVLEKSKSGDKEFYENVSPDTIGQFFKAIWGAYLNLLMFVYFKTFMDHEWDEYWSKFFLISSFFQNLCENNCVKFKELLNSQNFGMIEMMRGQAQPGSRSVFFENYILLEVLTMNSNAWLNDDKKIVPSDRPEMFQMIRQVMENVTEMLNGPCQNNQLKIFIFRIDMWTGIINRIVDDIDSKFYELKLACLQYISALLEGLNDQIVQFMGSNLEVHKLFELIIVLTKKLYLKRKMADKGQINQMVKNQKSIFGKRNGSALNKIAANIMFIAKSSQHLLEEIQNPQQLFDLYNKHDDFSEHIIMNIIIATFVMIKNMSTKIKFYELYIKDKERVSKNYQLEVKYREEAIIFYFISKIIADIEIVYKSNDTTFLQKFYFKMPPRCFFLTHEMMKRYMEETTVESTIAKRNFLYNNVDALSIEMKENQRNFARFSSFSVVMTNDAFHNYQMFLVLFSVVLNIFMLIYLENARGNGLSSYNSLGKTLINAIGGVLAVISFICVFIWLLFMYKMEVKVLIAKHQALSADALTSREFLNILFVKGLLLHPRFNFFLLQFIFTIMGLFVNNVFFTLNLLLLANLSKPINYIMRSIINHYDKLLITLLLTILVIFSYSFILLSNFAGAVNREIYGESVCDNFVACFVNSVNLGLRLDGGIGDSLSLFANTGDRGAFWGRFFFDLSFFIIVRLILLNVVAGIIIDTFSDLRDELTTKTHDVRNICYICGVDRWKLEQKGVDFDEHIEEEHNKWKYLFFIVKLTLSDRRAFTGIEFFVWERYEKSDSSWMPTEIYLKKGENSTPLLAQ